MPEWVQSGKCWVHVWEKGKERKTLNHPRGSKGSVLLPKRNFFSVLFFFFLFSFGHYIWYYLSVVILVFYGQKWFLFLYLSQITVQSFFLGDFYKRQNSSYFGEREALVKRKGPLGCFQKRYSSSVRVALPFPKCHIVGLIQ